MLKDFFTGCGTLILIGILIFIIVPLIIIGFKLALWLAVPIIILLIIIFATAVFGRAVSETRKRW
ncbi:MAG: hypothetical protein ACQER7_12065 [Bacteroidota bacterium]